MTPVTGYDPKFFPQNFLDIYQNGCLQKTRAQNIDIWPNDGHIVTIKKITKPLGSLADLNFSYVY